MATNDLLAALGAKVGAGTYAAVNSGVFGTDADRGRHPLQASPRSGASAARRCFRAGASPSGPHGRRRAAAAGPAASARSGLNGGFWFVGRPPEEQGQVAPPRATSTRGKGLLEPGAHRAGEGAAKQLRQLGFGLPISLLKQAELVQSVKILVKFHCILPALLMHLEG